MAPPKREPGGDGIVKSAGKLAAGALALAAYNNRRSAYAGASRLVQVIAKHHQTRAAVLRSCGAAAVVSASAYCLWRAADVTFHKVLRWAGGEVSCQVMVTGTVKTRNERDVYCLIGGGFAVRLAEGGPLMPVRLTTIERGPSGAITEKFELTGDGPLLNESHVIDDGGHTVATQGTSPGFLVGLGFVAGGVLNPTAIGWRHGDYLLTAAHAVMSPTGLQCSVEPVMFNLFNPEKVARLNLAAGKITGYTNYQSATASDLAAIEVSRDAWAVVGVRSARATNYSHQAEGVVHVWGHPSGQPLVNTGVLVHDIEAGRWGLLHHKVNTEHSFSGSPICRKVSGMFIIVGMHICGDKGNGANTGVSSWTILKMRTRLGLVPTIVDRTLGLLSESKDPRQQQPYPDQTEEIDFSSDRMAEDLAMQMEYGMSGMEISGRRQARARRAEDRADLLESAGIVQAPLPLHVRLSNAVDQSYPVSVDIAERINDGRREYVVEYEVAKEGIAVMEDSLQRPLEYARDKRSIAEIMKPLLGAGGKQDVRGLFELVQHSPYDVYHSPEFLPLRNYVACGDRREVQSAGTGEDVQTMKDKDGLPCFVHAAWVDVRGSKISPLRGMTPEEVEFLKTHAPGIAQKASSFVWPPQGSKAVESSMEAQAAEQSRCYMSDIDVDRWESFLADNTPYHYWGPVFSKYRTFWQRMADEMNKEKSSGWTKEYKSGTKRAILEDPDQLQAIYNISLLRLGMVICVGWTRLGAMTPMKMVEWGLKDPSVVSIKAEAHSASKAKRGAWRLIWAQSLVDAFVRLTTSHFGNKQDMKAYQNGSLHSLMGGLGHSDEGIRRIGTAIDWLSGPGLAPVWDRDTVGWDLGVTRDAIMLCAARRCDAAWVHHDDLATSEPSPDLVLKKRIQGLVLSNGVLSSAHVLAVGSKLFESCRFGQTDTGTVDTTNQNTFICAATAHNAGADRVACVGDDLMYSGVAPHFNERLAEWGMRCKDTTGAPFDDAIDFTSHLFRRSNGEWEAEFNNVDKMFAHLTFRAQGDNIMDRVTGCAFALRHSPQALEMLRSFAIAKGWLTPGANLEMVEGEWE